MTKVVKILVTVALTYFMSSASFAEMNIEKTLRSQQLTAFDLGILRLREDLNVAKNNIHKIIDIEETNIYSEVLYSGRNQKVQMIISTPLEKHLNERSYMADSIKCRKVFEKIKDNLLFGQSDSNGVYDRASAYLTAIFTSPTQWSAWRYDKKFTKHLVEFVDLEVTLRPTKEYAINNKVRPFSCGGNLASEYQEIQITRKFN